MKLLPLRLHDRCPICQFPFIFGNEQNKFAHLETCQGATDEAEECPAGLQCSAKEHLHFNTFSHFKLALSRCQGESVVIKEDISSFDTNITNFSHEKESKKHKISETVTSKSTVNCPDNLVFHMTGQIVYSEEIVSLKKMTINFGALDMNCDICINNPMNISSINSCVKMNFLSEDGPTVPALNLHPIELNVTFNEKGWKQISINYISGFQVKVFELILGKCCHFVEVKCVFGKDDRFQDMNEVHAQTLARFDFDSMCLNECKSPEKTVVEKLWLNSNQKNEFQRKCAVGETSYDFQNSHSCEDVFDISTCKLTENIQEIQNDVKEKWKNLFKKNTSQSPTPVASTNLPCLERSKITSRPCPFYKRIPGTSFAVDAFQYGMIPGVTHYFLTHFHADHYCGLSKKFKQIIVCSSITAALVAKKLRVESKYLNVVKHMEASFIKNVKVTPLHANHCPGSLMFLFELQNGLSYLHVGDFRADSQMEKYPALSGLNVDILFLDTTYCNPKYEFPTQESVVEGVIEIARKHMKLHSNTLFVCGTYTIGKEKVFMGLADALQCKVWASKAKLEVLRCFNDKKLNSKLVEDPSKAQVHLWPMGNLNHE
ncbi:Uncharacterized protein GBIM_17775, partial [Gryllus bimaculatus]